MRKFVASVALATAVASGSALLVSTPAGASPVYFGPGAPNQNWTGSLGLDFIVNTPIVVNALGAYSGADAYADIFVEIFTGTGTPVPGLQATIATTSSPYTWLPVTPVTLGPGTYQVTAWGYGPIGNYNTGISPGTPISFDTLGGALTEGSPYYNAPGVTGFATILDNFNGGGDHYYGAGNIDASATPLPSTWLMLLSGFVGFGFLAYRGAKRGSAAIAAA
jgi:hypothetical protein